MLQRCHPEPWHDSSLPRLMNGRLLSSEPCKYLHRARKQTDSSHSYYALYVRAILRNSFALMNGDLTSEPLKLPTLSRETESSPLSHHAMCIRHVAKERDDYIKLSHSQTFSYVH